MSDLKYRTINELYDIKNSTVNYIDSLKREIGKLTGKINNMNTRLEWVNIYINKKTLESENHSSYEDEFEKLMKQRREIDMRLIEIIKDHKAGE